MKKLLEHSNTILILRAVLGIIFIYASIDKITDPLTFSNAIDNYHITPIMLNNIIALIIPWIELIIGICLITGVFLDGSSIISIILLLIFIFMICFYNRC